MTFVEFIVSLIAAMVVWAMVKRLMASKKGGQREIAWMPRELREARLIWSEKTFTCEEPVPMVARIDRAYQAADGELTLIEFKHRSALRTYLSDVVELSAQRYVVEKAGFAVSRRAYVVVVPPDGDRSRALPVLLEDAASVERRVARLVSLREGRFRPEGADHAAVCRSCGHSEVCALKHE